MPTEPLFTDTLQVAIVVRDVDAALQTYVHEYGIGPWDIYEFNSGNVEGMVKDDESADYAMRIAITTVGTVQWELIEPLDDRSMYAEHLAEHGEGLHHVGVGVRSYDDTMGVVRSKGHKVLQGGHYNGVTFAYLSTDRDLKVITEIFDGSPGADQKPDAVYP
jgi:methylmalonyl-CoA/ethylmalonyl-CoA epimerase